jgi:hypothetical protein
VRPSSVYLQWPCTNRHSCSPLIPVKLTKGQTNSICLSQCITCEKKRHISGNKITNALRISSTEASEKHLLISFSLQIEDLSLFYLFISQWLFPPPDSILIYLVSFLSESKQYKQALYEDHCQKHKNAIIMEMSITGK